MRAKIPDVPADHEWSVPCRLERHCTVTIYARTKGEAREKFMALDWPQQDDMLGELVNWDITGEIKDEGIAF